jgi:deoxyribodipyrimidine photo-lyase
MSRQLVVWWVKRDARLADNAVLTQAAEMGALVLPLFCFEPSVMAAGDCSAMHLHAQSQAVHHLREALRRRNADLVIAHGEAVEKLQKLWERIPFTHLFSHEEVGNDVTFRRDRAVSAWCQERGVIYREFPQSSVRRGGVNRDRLQAVWRSRIVETRPLEVASIEQSNEIQQLAGKTVAPRLEFPAIANSWQPVTEAAAARTLEDFLNRRGRWYRGGISSPNTADTAGSRLSVHLAWGTITAKQVWHATRKRIDELNDGSPASRRWKLSLQSFLSRLHWRDHFSQRLESEPELEFRSIHPSYRDLPYENDAQLFTAWREGMTGFPMIDAVMRCLAATGFVNFRMRAMVVSFACHALHLDWRLIHPHLASVFRDYDPGIHLSQLQMQAGVVGWNAIRVYSPAKQLIDWDSESRFVKRWLPELKDVPVERIIHSSGGALGGYPSPVVDFATRTKQMTDMLYQIRKSAAAKAATPAVYAKHGSRRPDSSFRPRRKGRLAKSGRKQDPAQGLLFD